jgi:hypothetical protein
MTKYKFPMRYLPKQLSKKDKIKQTKLINKSKKLYKKNIYYQRPKLSSFKNKTSNHILKARKIYNIDKIIPNKLLSQKTGCSIKGLKQIVKKGEGAYYSSGSRPNQTARSWGLARLASSITSGKSASVDYKIIEKECNHNKLAFKLANKSRRKYKYGHSKTRKVKISI